MKKIISIILVMLFAFSLWGCEQIEKLEAVELPPLPTATPAPTPETETEEEVASTETEKDSTEEEVDPGNALSNQIIVNNRSTVLREYDPAEGKELILTYAYDTPTVYIEGRDEVAYEINNMISLIDESFYTGNEHGTDTIISASGYNMMLELAQDNYSYVINSGVTELPFELTASRTASIPRADAEVMSIVYSVYQYTGGDKGVYLDRAYVFDTRTGEELSLDRISSDFDSLVAFMVQYMVESAEADVEGYYSQRINSEALAGNTEAYSAAFGAMIREGSWYFSNEGIVLFSDSYEFGDYDDGIVKFLIPYAELEGKIDARFIPSPRSGEAEFKICYLSQLTEGSVEIVDLVNVDEDGEQICILVEGTAYNVRISAVDYTDRFFETAQLWHASYMEDSAVQIMTLIPEGMPRLMFSYSDAEGQRHQYLISQSGEDGSLVLADESIEAVG